MIKMICPECGSKAIVRDACATWNERLQQWELEGLYDSETCQDCDAEGDGLAARKECTEA